MKNKLNILIFSSIFLILTLFSISIYLDIQYQNDLLNKQLTTLESSIKNEYKQRLKESINSTIVYIDTMYKHLIKEQKNHLKLNTKNKRILIDETRKYLYNNIQDMLRYTWINKIINYKGGDNFAIRLIHPNLKHTEGSFLSTKTKDIKGNLPYLEELNGIKKDKEIYYTYYFKQLNTLEATEKLSYAKLYKKMDWIIVTGIPLNSLNELIKNEKDYLKRIHKKDTYTLTFYRGIILVLFILILLILRKKLILTLNENEKLNEKLEKKLKNVETNFNKFFELPINIFLISDLKGKILQINSGWEKILGYKAEELVNTNYLDLVHPHDIDKTLIAMKELEQGHDLLFFENRYKHKNGSYKTLAWSANVLQENGLIYGSALNITELKEKSEIIYQQSKMAAIGEMTANISHQWRQPLSVISTASSGLLLKKSIDDLDDEFLINTLEQITQSTQYLSDTIEDFRNFYTPTREKTEFKIEHVVKKTLNLVKKRYENENIKIIKNISDITIVNFENQFLQVLINLLNNARDQLCKSKDINKLIFINAYKKDTKVIFEIIDNGGGIKEDIIDKIFEPYFTTKDKSIGTGIGLYMSEEIIVKHFEGQIKVENHTFSYKDKEYVGAKFTIEFNN
ncbi:multi-sensor signal transduction histidine kinase [Arcobacter nitrofigilis DSM 7299]|uniref:histidine kinase n=1 Tax=Arcobacter nitrofigilis (strain ATCC 33309 / DSM 7299 / CCUG 15893 / LMG 7604 / NCTC 12251 / CI) TaxID=572480 RepID=D5V6W5_ARCNC|nr:ATP-binding protein [Arcobacter nitrofigilis]ADG94385.1 multi-sensor signal transduction histidine kinase [Arcobacter nitrofigilis DSM 7299]